MRILTNGEDRMLPVRVVRTLGDQGSCMEHFELPETDSTHKHIMDIFKFAILSMNLHNDFDEGMV
jgi:hypothetical protein